MAWASWADRQFLRENDGVFIGSMSEQDQEAARDLARAGHARITYNLLGMAKLERVPISYGDGKKSPYGVTYADEICDDVLGA